MLPSVTRFSPRELEALQAAAKADEHYVSQPTHLVKKNGEIAGYWSINGIPHVHLWHDSKSLTARDSVALRNMLDSIAAIH